MDPEALVVDGPDVDDKSRRGSLGAVREAARCLYRHAEDVAGASMLLTWVGFDYSYVMLELLQAPDTFGTQVFKFIATALLVLYAASWISLACHGPGRSPDLAPLGPKSPGAQLTPNLRAALEVGRFASKPSFGGEVEWCNKCGKWKPALVHHCRICGNCSLWMDHHCVFAGQCVGFRNMRCYILWLMYGQAILIFSAICFVRRYYLAFSPPSGLWGTVLLVLWVLGVVRTYTFIAKYKAHSLHNLCYGWPSSVQLQKHRNLLKDVEALRKKFKTLEPNGGIDDVVPEEQAEAAERELAEALAGVKTPGGNPCGHFKGNEDLDGVGSGNQRYLDMPFGEAFSLKWFVPFIPGGDGDPVTADDLYNADVCAAWAHLAAVLRRYDGLVTKRLEALEAWNRSISEWKPVN